ncbi:transposase [Bradyrhizobium elkanii]|uniref:transposase n=1 Tax=Bradyrhizobium elkanii TaxID=29448 RepID=UPI0034E44993
MRAEYRRDRRYARNQNGKRKVVVVRERGGNSVPAVFGSESQAAAFIRARIGKGTVVHADEVASWDGLHERFEMKRVNTPWMVRALIRLRSISAVCAVPGLLALTCFTRRSPHGMRTAAGSRMGIR